MRKIRIDNSGNLLVYAIEFSYNLIAPVQKQETVYEFDYIEESKSWMFNKILSK